MDVIRRIAYAIGACDFAFLAGIVSVSSHASRVIPVTRSLRVEPADDEHTATRNVYRCVNYHFF